MSWCADVEFRVTQVEAAEQHNIAAYSNPGPPPSLT